LLNKLQEFKTDVLNIQNHNKILQKQVETKEFELKKISLYLKEVGD